MRRLPRAFARLLLHAVQLRAQAGQRGAQVMGNVVAYALDLVHQAFDALEHGVDDGRQHVQFIAAAGQRQASGQVAGDDRFGAGLDPANTPQRAAAQQVPTDDARDNGQGHAPEQRMENDPGHGKQRTVVPQQHQPATVLGLGRHRVATVVGQGRVVGVGAVAEHVNLAVKRQAFGDMAQRAAEVAMVFIEQAIGVEARNVEAHADGEGVHQLFAGKTREQVLALHQRVLGQVVQVSGHLVVHDPHENPAPEHEQRTVERQQPAAGRAPAFRGVRQ
ncbi:hypothetical protein D3C86_1431840 [compost metagenome]